VLFNFVDIDFFKTIMDTIVNKIAESGIITLNLESYLPGEDSLAVFDIKPFLFKEMILREKDFREALPQHDWQQYSGKHVAITCSTDAIIPMWAYMLIVSSLTGIAASVFYGTLSALTQYLTIQNIESVDISEFADKRVVIKGCGAIPIDPGAFVAISAKLRPVVKSLMYGEPCSTVPVYKRKKP
jgi:hypothetical protein